MMKKFIFLKTQLLDVLIYQAKMISFIMISYSMGGFLSKWISSRDEILLVSSWDETHV